MHASLQLPLLLGLYNIVLVQAQDAAPAPVINTPTSLAQCLPSMLTFSGGTPPYMISAIPARQPTAPPLTEIGTQSGPNATWYVNQPAGTELTLQIRDSTGTINYSQAVTVQKSDNSTCLRAGQSGSSGSTSTNTPATPNTPGGTSGSNTSPLPPTTNTSTLPSGNSSAPTKGPSPFSPSSNTTKASDNARSSAAAPGLVIQHQSLAIGLVIVGATMALFA